MKLESFFSEHLEVQGLKVERITEGGLIVFSQDDEVFAVMKYMTDLGYSRGDKFYESIEHITQTANRLYGLGPERVLILTASLINGIDKAHVEALINQDISSNLEFLQNTNLVFQFLQEYIQKAPKAIQENLFFLSADLHPNALADEISKGEISTHEVIGELEDHEWIKTAETILKRIEYLVVR